MKGGRDWGRRGGERGGGAGKQAVSVMQIVRKIEWVPRHTKPPNGLALRRSLVSGLRG